MDGIDLHIHTVHSDGTATVAEVLTMAQRLGLSVLAISDHNTVDAYRQLPQHRHLFSGSILPAVELTTSFRGEVVEVLGYGIDLKQMDGHIRSAYMDNNTRRIHEAALITKALVDKGVRLGEDFVRLMCTDPESAVEGFHHIGCRPLILAEMRKYKENGSFFGVEDTWMQITASGFARNFLFNPRTELYVDIAPLFPPMEQVIGWIHEGEGLAFLAHPFVYSDGVVAALDELCALYRPDGMECHYGTFTEQQKAFMCDYCHRNGLYKSGGSDFHGLDARPSNPMGRSDGVTIPKTMIDPWIGKVKLL